MCSFKSIFILSSDEIMKESFARACKRLKDVLTEGVDLLTFRTEYSKFSVYCIDCNVHVKQRTSQVEFISPALETI